MQEVQEPWVQSLGCEDPLGKEMETHSSILAWRIPWTEVPGGLQSMGPQREQAWSDLAHISPASNKPLFVVVIQSLSRTPTLCDPMDCSTPGFPVLHCRPEFAQTPVHWVHNAFFFPQNKGNIAIYCFHFTITEEKLLALHNVKLGKLLYLIKLIKQFLFQFPE